MIVLLFPGYVPIARATGFYLIPRDKWGSERESKSGQTASPPGLKYVDKIYPKRETAADQWQ